MKFNFFKKLRFWKAKPLTNAERVSVARTKIESAFNVFIEMDKEIEMVNKDLEGVIEEDTQLILDTVQNRTNAEDELAMNKAMQENLAQFIVK